jgi:hypothetical protein
MRSKGPPPPLPGAGELEAALKEIRADEAKAVHEPPQGGIQGWLPKAVLLVVGLIAMAVVGVVGKNAGNWIVPAPKSFEALLSDALRKENEKLPMMVDELTRLDRVRVSAPNVVQYDYTLPNNIDSPSQFGSIEKELRATVVSRACSPSGVAHFLDRGITTFYTYRAHDGGLIGAITVTKANCQPHSDQPRPIFLEMKESDRMSDIEWLYFITDRMRQQELAGR